MRFGQDAIDELVDRHPKAYKFFGEHRSIEHFAISISTPNWFVLKEDSPRGPCWLMAEMVELDIYEMHWFCPKGADIATLRGLLHTMFMVTGARLVRGTVPANHTNERRARFVNRALGAWKVDGTYLLTRARHMAYNHKRIRRGA